LIAVFGQIIVRIGNAGGSLRAAETAADPNSTRSSGLLTIDDLNLDRSDTAKIDLLRKFTYAIVLVVLLGIGACWFTKKFAPGLAVSKGKNITVLETISLGTGKTLHLIEVTNHQKLLLGCTAQSISLLAHLGDPIPQLPDTLEED
jgi:flagellar biogenesis protein FliO